VGNFVGFTVGDHVGRNVGVKQNGKVLIPGANWSFKAIGAVRALNEHKLVGTGSRNEFKLKSSTFSEDIDPTVAGMVWESILSDTRKYSSPVSLPSCDGIVPSSKKFVFALSVFKLLKSPNEDGRTPANEFKSNTNEVSDTSFPIEGEMVPTTPFDETSTAITNTPSQVTPLQPHTLLSGIRPVHRHPLTPPRLFKFVAAATSHIASSLGIAVGAAVGDRVGLKVGAEVGVIDGWLEGSADGQQVGLPDGSSVGRPDGWPDGCSVGELEGCPDGFADGCSVGCADG
jgi:hypothetical protein